jgi:hypothetical protein
MMPSMSYSTGSSAVSSLESMVLTRRKAGVKRGGLAAAGRAGDDENAVGLLMASVT